MQVNLSSKIETHLERLETMAEEAAKDEDESYSSRASAMSALSNILKELVKSQYDCNTRTSGLDSRSIRGSRSRV